MPQKDDGTRIEPLVSEPSVIGTRPAASAAPDPLDEPPDMRAEVVRIAADAVMGVLAGEVVGVFAHVERADADGAGRDHELHQRRVGCRRRVVAVDEGAGAGRHAGEVEEVLDREGHAGERQPLAGGNPAVHRLRLGQRPRGRDVGEGIDGFVDGRDALDGAAGDIDGGELSPR